MGKLSHHFLARGKEGTFAVSQQETAQIGDDAKLTGFSIVQGRTKPWKAGF